MASSSDAPHTPDCCPPGSWDAPLNPSGPPTVKGKSITLHGDGADEKHHVDIYATGEVKSKKAIIVFTDIWGSTDRAKAICDKLAESGYHVVMPDCFRGETKATNPDIVSWLSRYPYSLISKDINACLRYLSTEAGVEETRPPMLSVGALGFCWGVWALAKASAAGVSLRCGVGCHPSTAIEERVFGKDERAMIEAVRMPLLVLPAGNDDEKMKPGGEYAVCLEAKGGGSVEFPEMVHGWSCRGDMTDDKVRRDAEKALVSATDFFKKNM